MHGSPDPSETHPDSTQDTDPTTGSTDQDPETKQSEVGEGALVVVENPAIDPRLEGTSEAGAGENVAEDSEVLSLAAKSQLVAAAMKKYAAPRSSSYHGVTRLNLCLICCLDHLVIFFKVYVVFIVFCLF